MAILTYIKRHTDDVTLLIIPALYNTEYRWASATLFLVPILCIVI